jgi:hypothetical protein
MRDKTHLPRPIPLRGAPASRSFGLVALVAAAALAVAACGGSSGPHVASLPASNAPASTAGATTSQARATTSKHGNSSTTRSAKGNPTALLDEWATCMQSHGDPNQAAPTVDAYGVINVTIPSGAAQTLSGEVHAGVDPCNHYMAAAQTALRAANPVGSPPDQAEQIKYVNCLRANGYPTFPYPQGNQTNFNGTGIDPTSPAFVNGKANQTCGKQIGAPSWWTNGTGPPGDVVVGSAGIGPNGPVNGAAPNRPRQAPGGNGSGATTPVHPGG